MIKEGRPIKLHLWDTAGQERFKSITQTYYRGAVGAVVVFDLTNQKSFESAKSWLSLARQVCGESLSVVLVGNKSDLDRDSKLDKNSIISYC